MARVKLVDGDLFLLCDADADEREEVQCAQDWSTHSSY